MRAFGKSSLLKTLACAAALAAAAVLPACSDSSDPLPQNDDGTDVVLRLNVEFGLDNGATSRTDAGVGDEDYEPLSGDFEAVATLRVIIFSADGTTVDANRMVKMKDLKPVDDNLEFLIDKADFGDNPTPTTTIEKQIYLIANESSLTVPAGITGYTSVSDWLNSFNAVKTDGINANQAQIELNKTLVGALTDWTVSFPFDRGEIKGTPMSPFGGGRLPMTEMFEVPVKRVGDQLLSVSTSNEAIYVQNVNLFMTSAAAKATFRFDFSEFEGSGSQVTGIQLIGLSQTEYVFPNSAVYSEPKYTAAGLVNALGDDGKFINRYITSFASPDPNGNSGLTYTLTADNGFTPVAMKKNANLVATAPVYFPESLSDNAAPAYQVKVRIDDGPWLTAQPLVDNIMELPNDGGEAIARNTHLYIDISFTPVGITWQAIVAPYNTKVLEPNFGLEVP